MNALTAHLEASFDAYPKTTQILDAKAELRAMMEDSYENLIADGVDPSTAVGRVIADFGNLDELAPSLGIAYPSLKDDFRRPDDTSVHPPVTLSEARRFSETARVARLSVGVAVAALVASPAPVVLLLAGVEVGIIRLSVEGALAIGISLFLLMTAAGALCLVRTYSRLAPSTRLREGRFTPNTSVEQWADTLALTHERRRGTSLAIAVTLWSLSPAALVLTTLVAPVPTQGAWILAGAGVALLATAVGLLLHVPATWALFVKLTLTRPRRGLQ